MANYFYVKAGGTASGATVDSSDGVYSTQKTGTWGSAFSGVGEYFDSITAAFAATVTPNDGDVICVSDTHNKSYGSPLSWNTHASDGTDYIRIISVDDTAIDEYKKGAQEHPNSGGDIRLVGNLIIQGMRIDSGDDFLSQSAGGTRWIDCALNLTTSGSNIQIATNNRWMHFVDTDITLNTATGVFTNTFSITNGGSLLMEGGSINQTAGTLANLVTASSSLVARFIGVDLSGIDFDGGAAYGNFFDESAIKTDGCVMEMHNCKLPTFDEYMDFVHGSPAGHLLVTGCGATAAEATYQYFLTTSSGYVESTTAIYRDESTALGKDSTEKISLKVDTTSTTGPNWPMVFKMPSRFCDLTDAGEDTLTVNFACTNTLTENDVWVEVYYPDATNKHETTATLSVANGWSTDFNGVASSLTAGTSDWRDGSDDSALTGYNEYQISVTTSSGAECVPEIRIGIAKASETIYVCPTIDVS